MQPEVLITIITVAGANIAVVAGFLKWFVPWWYSRRRAVVVAGLRQVSDMYRIMSASLEQGVDRCIMFAAHNSGGVPRVGSPLYATALHWVVRAEHYGQIQRYDRVSVDAFYVQMLLEMYARGYYRFTTSAHKPCQLRDIYELEGVTDSALFFIAIRDNQFLYISFAKYGGAFLDRDITQLRIQVSNISANITP